MNNQNEQEVKVKKKKLVLELELPDEEAEQIQAVASVSGLTVEELIRKFISDVVVGEGHNRREIMHHAVNWVIESGYEYYLERKKARSQ